jgi:hypothetical protein
MVNGQWGIFDSIIPDNILKHFIISLPGRINIKLLVV